MVLKRNTAPYCGEGLEVRFASTGLAAFDVFNDSGLPVNSL